MGRYGGLAERLNCSLDWEGDWILPDAKSTNVTLSGDPRKDPFVDLKFSY